MKIVMDTSADVAALQMVLENDDDAMVWLLSNLLGIKWQEENNQIELCDLFGEKILSKLYNSPYVVFQEIDLSKLDRDQIISLMKRHYSIILPINTKTFGITNKEFFHNVFLCDFSENEIWVYDFWAPLFKWGKKSFSFDKVLNAVKMNLHHNNKGYILKKTNSSLSKKEIEKYFLAKVKKILMKPIKMGQYFENLNVYNYLKQYINQLDNIFPLDHTIFHNLVKHFEIWEFVIERIPSLNDEEIKSSLLLLRQKAMHLRNLSMKYWLKYKDNKNLEWKSIFIETILFIRQRESSVFEQMILKFDENK